MQRFHTAIIEQAKDGFGVFAPDFPGCTSFGKTVEDAAKNAFTAAQAHVALSIEYGDGIPAPRAGQDRARTWREEEADEGKVVE